MTFRRTALLAAALSLLGGDGDATGQTTPTAGFVLHSSADYA